MSLCGVKTLINALYSTREIPYQCFPATKTQMTSYVYHYEDSRYNFSVTEATPSLESDRSRCPATTGVCSESGKETQFD